MRNPSAGTLIPTTLKIKPEGDAAAALLTRTRGQQGDVATTTRRTLRAMVTTTTTMIRRGSGTVGDEDSTAQAREQPSWHSAAVA